MVFKLKRNRTSSILMTINPKHLYQVSKDILTAEPQFLEGDKRAEADEFVEESQTANTMTQCPSETRSHPEY